MKTDSETIRHRLEQLRDWMEGRALDAFIFPTTDPHQGEYVPDHWKAREWVSGFDGSAGTVVVTAAAAALWTDSRYFIAAARQLKGTGILLMRERLEGTPSIPEWLHSILGEGRVGLDGEVNSASEVRALVASLTAKGRYEVLTHLDPLDALWASRPALPMASLRVHPLEYAGEAVAEKLRRVREAICQAKARSLLVTTLDDIAWTLNLRGSDVHCNPVFVSYLLITTQGATLFVDSRKLTPEVCRHLTESGVETKEYCDIAHCLADTDVWPVMADPDTVNHTLYSQVEGHAVEAPSPIPRMKAVKNEVEMEGFRRAMVRDGVAMVKFLSRLQGWVDEGTETEMSVDRQLTDLRARQPLSRGNSFDTIAAYGAHAAIVHYEATKATDCTLLPEGLLLIDSGGQYLDGTTDITRTVALGPLTERQREVYTLVLKGHIQLQLLKFPKGACGSQLDAVARKDLWAAGLNFMHGTGHGVGSYLNVHEGPHQIRMEWRPEPLVPGMTVTDEPGIYIENQFGVRIENTLLVVPYMTTDMGEFLQFETLTLCPIDLTPVVKEMLTPEEVKWLDDYHRRVCDALSPYLDSDEREWLRQKAISWPNDKKERKKT